jgi:transcriptional regulator with GAF, ATPase, and Fis domain
MAGQADQRARLRDENAYLRHELNGFVGAPAIVGNSPAARRMLEQLRQVAASDAAVLLLGETGTGKSLLAHRIHEVSGRGGRAMVRFNCASLTASSVEAELFGREKGAYLDGESRQVGLLELGRGSTVFFDEVADLTPDLQASLARVLQTKEIVPLGSTRPIKVDFKVIAATRHDLAAAIEEGSFRDDLYYRLNVLSIHVPPLRERAEDIPQLVWRFVDEFSAAYGKSIETIDHESMEQLQRYDWPGNARELRNVVERAMIVATGRRLRIALPSPGGAASRDADTLAAVEKAHIAAILGACRGQITGPVGAAARLGLTPRALEAKLARYGIRRKRL